MDSDTSFEQRGRISLTLKHFKGYFTWIFGNEGPGFYSYKEPATELKCQFALPNQFISPKVRWTYAFSHDAKDTEVRQSDVSWFRIHISNIVFGL